MLAIGKCWAMSWAFWVRTGNRRAAHWATGQVFDALLLIAAQLEEGLMLGLVEIGEGRDDLGQR